MKPDRSTKGTTDTMMHGRNRHDEKGLDRPGEGKSSCSETECGRTRLGAGQDPAKRRQILEGAQDVFLRMGFDAASMNDITREAGVSKGTIYVYFNSKEDLFVALCEHYRDTMFRELIEKLDKGFNSRQQLTDFGVALVTLITSSTAVRAQRIVLGVSERKPELAARFYERGPKRSLVLMADYLKDMIEKGELEPFDPEKMAYHLSDLFLSGLYRPRLFGALPEPPSAETIRENVDLAIDFFYRAYGRNQGSVQQENN
ncbi:TetR/AcrR family transcriptional regulator [Ochrobactrum vermis]|uniref:TetR/AcrR family transcriptional regulator n=1 Tax=Ochrobactrum vermis TaxID=1827297 RepID=A0ABU8PGN5_9HYPH|nr:TetR/AcrR family transcriptional regulator [Ochrobactrum vermis]PQZ25725.1 TetR family transcriptional regulator [Ochrobactrum vermis]